MKREFLRNLDLGDGARLPKEAEDAIMAEYGRDVIETKRQLDDVTADRDAWKSKAESAEAIVQKIPKDQDPAKLLEALEEANTNLANAQKDYNDKIAKRDFEDALKTALDGIKFSSGAAKEAVAAKLRDAGLPLQDGKIIGLSDMIASIKEKDASAFVDEKQEELEQGKARFTGKMAPAGSGGKTKEEIEAITDKAERRAAIAANLNLFEGEA